MSNINDTICLDCPARGLCCHGEMELKGKRVVLPFSCEFLDPETKLCAIYNRRHDRMKLTGAECLTIEQMLDAHTVPVACLYITDKAAYRKIADRRYYNFEVKVND